MKILCISDHVDPLVYSQTIKNRFKDVELVLSSGDLPLSYYDFIMTSLNKPLLFVFGNHQLRGMKEFKESLNILGGYCPWDHERNEPPPPGATYIGKKICREKCVLIAGLGGCMWYNGGANQYTDLQMFFHIVGMIPAFLINKLRFGRFLDILITHSPPYGIHDGSDRCHTGFKSFLWFMRVFKPKYLVHGHVHLYTHNAERISNYFTTKITNAYNHLVIDLEM